MLLLRLKGLLITKYCIEFSIPVKNWKINPTIGWRTIHSIDPDWKLYKKKHCRNMKRKKISAVEKQAINMQRKWKKERTLFSGRTLWTHSVDFSFFQENNIGVININRPVTSQKLHEFSRYYCRIIDYFRFLSIRGMEIDSGNCA